jgi:hypothetical protein
MSLRAIPLTFLVFVLYNVIVLFSGSSAGEANGAAGATALLSSEIVGIPMMSPGTVWSFTWGDLILTITLFVLFAEILKATYTSTSSLVDHGLSMLVFIAALVEFIVVPQAATSVFFLVLVALLIDVIAGFTIGIRVAKRDIGFGGGDQ